MRGDVAGRVIGLRFSPASITQKHVAVQPWPTKLARIFPSFVFCTIFDSFSSLQVHSRKKTEVIIFLQIPVPPARVSQYPRDSWWHLFSLPAHHTLPLPSASPSIHSQPTPVVEEKRRVERAHPIP
jgi:hypothetical protein